MASLALSAVALVDWPKEPMPMRATTRIRDATNKYSIAVAPRRRCEPCMERGEGLGEVRRITGFPPRGDSGVRPVGRCLWSLCLLSDRRAPGRKCLAPGAR